MTRITYNQQVGQANHVDSNFRSMKEDDQVVYLKRLLVTLKQQYEKQLHVLYEELQTKKARVSLLEKQIEEFENASDSSEKFDGEELHAIRLQQITLLGLLKKDREDLAQLRLLTSVSPPSRQGDQSEPMVPFWKERASEAESLKQELELAQKKIICLQSELSGNRQHHERQGKELRELSGNITDSSLSVTLGDSLRKELEVIKTMIFEDSLSFEKKYTEVLKEKIGLENQLKDQLRQLEHQSNNLTSFKESVQASEGLKKQLEESLKEKVKLLEERKVHESEMEEKVARLTLLSEDTLDLRDKYESLKDEWRSLSDQLDESIEFRIRLERHLAELALVGEDREAAAAEQNIQLVRLIHEKEEAFDSLVELRCLMEEREDQLKTAQQHLAKKVKEVALLEERLEELLNLYQESRLELDSSSGQITHLQIELDGFQSREKGLRDQLHETLKSNESQSSKWEEKYFHMYDKWQESEAQIRELKKLEEKHLQMQTVLANLGSFMGTSFTPSSLFQVARESMGESLKPSFFDGEAAVPPSSRAQPVNPPEEKKYDLFGMKYIEPKNSD